MACASGFDTGFLHLIQVEHGPDHRRIDTLRHDAFGADLAVLCTVTRFPSTPNSPMR